MPQAKLDLTKEYESYYAAKTTPEIVDIEVAKLEGLWWVDSDKPYSEVPREEWRWKLLIRQPGFVSPEIVEEVKKEVIKKKKMELVAEVKFERMKEGKCVQILHRGPYSTKPESLAKMYKLMEDEGLVPNGLHHEIYLVSSGLREVPEEKWRTILRQPVKKKA
ncbi:MAG: GyrI-like domain-containing protein [Acidobacteria bacterium]|nr:GyrI-like domain-containing protein [Acidobacteriota bacterium]